MKRTGRALVIVSVLIAAVLVEVSPASAGDGPGSGSCNVIKDPTCTVGVGGGSGNGGGNGGGPGTSTDPCASYPQAAYGDKPPKVSQACADELQYNYCQALVADAADGLEAPPSAWSPEQVALINAGLAQQGCPPVVTPAALAAQAFASIHFPRPSGERSPSQDQLYDGYPFTYVGLWTFFWTDPGTWHTLSATASAAGLSANVSAEPVALVYDPGDGRDAVTCSGPGRPWRNSDGNNAPTDGACGYLYRNVTSGPITSTQTIVWKITWTGTGNTGGQFPQLSTSTSGQLQVMQIQTVVTR